MKKKVDTGLMPMIIFVMDVFQTYMDDIDNIMKTKYKSIRIHPTIKSRGLSAMPSCKKCAYKTWDRKCLKCGTLFSSEGDQYCPTCYEDDDKEYKGRKATKKDINKLFDKVKRGMVQCPT